MFRSTTERVAFALGLGVCAVLLLARLGHYGLWDDEANTAIFAANVWQTGDTTAWDGTNLVAFRDGLELTGLKNRVYPPAQYFYAAPWLGLLGRNALAARLPFALTALLGFAMWAWWLFRVRAPWHVGVATFLAVVGNVSLFLYSRQSRYYAMGWALSLALVYLYEHRAESKRNRWLLVIGSIVLLAVHYLTWGATMVVLAVDQLLFQLRKDSWRTRALFVASQGVAVLVIVGTFFPFGRKVTGYVPASWVADKAKLFWWNLRDLNACEFMWSPVLLLAVLVFFVGRRKDLLLIRGVVGLVIYAAVASVLSVQPVGWATVSDIRYMVAAIPLGLFLTVRTATSLSFVPRWVSLGFVALVSLTTLLHRPFQALTEAPTTMPVRSTLGVWVAELLKPQRSAYAESSEWLNSHVGPGAKVFVLPDFAVYPLIFHAPTLSYMWQLRPDQRPEYPTLPEHTFRGMGVPDVLVAFGGDVHAMRGLVSQLEARGIAFEPEVRLDVAGPDRTRPELFWRSFWTIEPSPGEGTFIFRRRGAPTK
jgi:hypothetical protein